MCVCLAETKGNKTESAKHSSFSQLKSIRLLYMGGVSVLSFLLILLKSKPHIDSQATPLLTLTFLELKP